MKDLIIGCHAWFARSGASIGGDTVDSETLPVFASTKASWLELPHCEAFEVRRNKTTVKRRSPRTGGGRYQVRKTIITNAETMFAMDLQEWDKLTMELLFGADAIANDGTFTPDSQGSLPQGWLHIQLYDQDDVLIVEGDVWVELDVDSFKFGENLNPHALMAQVLSNELNEATLTNLT